MKKEYVRPELNVLSLMVEDNTNALEIEREHYDNYLSIGTDLGSLFGDD